MKYTKWIIAAIVAIIITVSLPACIKTIPAGHVGVASLFGKVNPNTYNEGMHFPINPFYKWEKFDLRRKTQKEIATVPCQDQLTVTMDVSIQYRIDGSKAAQSLQETGTVRDMVTVHLTPNFRSLLREQGKTVEKAEDFFKESVQSRCQVELTANLQKILAPNGIIVDNVLIRDVKLPPFILKAIEAKKEREQEVERQKASLEIFRTEQEEITVKAKAEKMAATEKAEALKIMADAEAYQIEKINKAIAGDPAYIQLQALEALKAISKDPSSKLYFMDSNSSQPIPLMHFGEKD